jgi:hypothetical protein
MTPEKGGVVKLCIRQLLTTVAASLDDSNVATEAGEVSEKTQEILSGHKRSSFFASDMIDSTPEAVVRPSGPARKPVCACGTSHTEMHVPCHEGTGRCM